MLDDRGRDIGTPKVRKIYLHATPEDVARTRADFERALSHMYSEMNGYPTKVTVDWPSKKPEGYGISDPLP